jgi:hypothetical protein
MMLERGENCNVFREKNIWNTYNCDFLLFSLLQQ